MINVPDIEGFISGSEVDGSEASSMRDQLHIEEPEAQGILSSGVQMSNRDFINLTEDLNHKFEASQAGDVIVTDHADNPNTASENQDETEVVSATSHTVDEETVSEKLDRLYASLNPEVKAKYHDFINLGFELRDQDCITLIHELNRNFEASRVDQVTTEER